VPATVALVKHLVGIGYRSKQLQYHWKKEVELSAFLLALALALALAVEEFVLVWVAEQRRTRTVPRLVVACGTTRIDIATTDRHGGCIILIVFIVRFNWLCSVGRWLCR
jgi:hypothetical protein